MAYLPDLTLALLMAVALLAFTTQALSGFGSMIITATLGVHLYPLELVLPVAIPLDVCLNGYIVLRHRKLLHTRLLLQEIVPFTALGLVLGIAVFALAEGVWLKRAFGVFVVVLCLRQLCWTKGDIGSPVRMATSGARLCFTGGGLIQGICASGGPLVVYAAGRMGLGKSAFRSTLSALWLGANAVLLFSYAMLGKVTPDTLEMTMTLVPAMVGGLLLGERLHRRVVERSFRVFIYCLLLLSGAAVAVP